MYVFRMDETYVVSTDSVFYYIANKEGCYRTQLDSVKMWPVLNVHGKEPLEMVMNIIANHWIHGSDSIQFPATDNPVDLSIDFDAVPDKPIISAYALSDIWMCLEAHETDDKLLLRQEYWGLSVQYGQKQYAVPTTWTLYDVYVQLCIKRFPLQMQEMCIDKNSPDERKLYLDVYDDDWYVLTNSVEDTVYYINRSGKVFDHFGAIYNSTHPWLVLPQLILNDCRGLQMSDSDPMEYAFLKEQRITHKVVKHIEITVCGCTAWLTTPDDSYIIKPLGMRCYALARNGKACYVSSYKTFSSTIGLILQASILGMHLFPCNHETAVMVADKFRRY